MSYLRKISNEDNSSMTLSGRGLNSNGREFGRFCVLYCHPYFYVMIESSDKWLVWGLSTNSFTREEWRRVENGLQKIIACSCTPFFHKQYLYKHRLYEHRLYEHRELQMGEKIKHHPSLTSLSFANFSLLKF